MINYHYIKKENTQENNPNWSQILDHPYRKLIARGSGFGNTNMLLDMIKQQNDDNYSAIDNILRIPMKQNIHIILKKLKIVVLKRLKHAKTIEYSNNMQDVYENMSTTRIENIKY